MRVTLASLLAEAMKDVSQFQSEDIDSQKYLEWVDKYQVIKLAFLFFCVMFKTRTGARFAGLKAAPSASFATANASDCQLVQKCREYGPLVLF